MEWEESWEYHPIISNDVNSWDVIPYELAMAQVEKALGVHCLAMRAGIQWLGDLPAPARTLLVEDTDGDRWGPDVWEVTDPQCKWGETW